MNAAFSLFDCRILPTPFVRQSVRFLLMPVCVALLIIFVEWVTCRQEDDNGKKLTYRTIQQAQRAERQRVSYACLSSLASWSCNSLNTAAAVVQGVPMTTGHSLSPRVCRSRTLYYYFRVCIFLAILGIGPLACLMSHGRYTACLIFTQPTTHNSHVTVSGVSEKSW